MPDGAASSSPFSAIAICPGCGGQLPAAFLACPACGRLVHSDRLKTVAAEAQIAEGEGDGARALERWREALGLLPPGSVQGERVLEKVQALSRLVPSSLSGAPTAAAAGASIAAVPPAADAAGGRSRRAKWAAGMGSVGVLLAKLKWVLLFLIPKGKALLVGLTQAKTFLTMALAVGVYATVYGWRFALGLVASIYVHEMGHVVWLRRYGIPATAPMFIPGLGAFVRLKQHPATVIEDARVGLAGPIWGAGAAVAALILGGALHQPILLAIARAGAWINLFNLAPVWQLDGGRGFAALSRRQRGTVAGVLWLLALAGADGVFYLLAAAATFRAAGKGPAPAAGDRQTLFTYLTLALGLALLMRAAAPLAGHVP